MNNKAKVRRSTKSIVLGKAKVMSFEDIKVARAARAAKEVIKGKGKRGRKHKSAALEADEPEADKPETEAEPEVAHTAKEVINGRGKRGRKRKSAAQEADEPEPEPEKIIALFFSSNGFLEAGSSRSHDQLLVSRAHALSPAHALSFDSDDYDRSSVTKRFEWFGQPAITFCSGWPGALVAMMHNYAMPRGCRLAEPRAQPRSNLYSHTNACRPTL
ncbi:hypothetical protein B0J14DRAFT_705200 [Halenospora varia]|nr:hypothetical protein B0J14DRAFT_705200 [Halenospora varia]